MMSTVQNLAALAGWPLAALGGIAILTVAFMAAGDKVPAWAAG